MMFWMAYGAGLVRQRVSLQCVGATKASNRICRQGGRCFLINLDLLAARGSPRVALKDFAERSKWKKALISRELGYPFQRSTDGVLSAFATGTFDSQDGPCPPFDQKPNQEEGRRYGLLKPLIALSEETPAQLSD